MSIPAANGGRSIRGQALPVLALAMWMGIASGAGAAEVQQHRDADSGLLSWSVEEPGLSLQLVQMLPDYVAAVYSSRGLPTTVLESIAAYCVFGTIVTNTSTTQVSYRVADWRYLTPDGREHRIKTKTQWLDEWKQMGVAYRWSILPDDQTFEPGDWSQGFTTIALPPDSVLTLVYSWSYQNETHEGRIEGLRCAPASAPKE
jgi:hypothetical protein